MTYLTTKRTVPMFVASVLCTLLVVFGSHMHTQVARAQSVDELREKIANSQQQLEEIEKEIKKYESQLNEVGAEKKTLQSAIRELDLSRQKIQADIRATEQKISSTDLEIDELDREIRIKELEVARNQEAVAETLRTADQIENQTPIELVLGYSSMAEVWNALADQASLQVSLQDNTRALNALKSEYERAKRRSLTKRDQLDELHNELSGQKSSLDQTRSQKDQLLGKTENKESNYQKLLAEKKAAREQFEQELHNYEAQLKFILDPSSIPAVGSGVLSWPFEPSYMRNCPSYKTALGNEQCITQFFGETAFAKSGAYRGKGHNGVDFRAPVGTKIVAALGGTVTAIGNTDAYKSCYSYGKWVLMRHSNGLSTLYAHLSSISVSAGQAVTTGQLLGYSGATGYVTGPHLHLSLFVTDGVKVQKLGDIPGRPITACSPASIPVAAFSAYLNPLDYL